MSLTIMATLAETMDGYLVWNPRCQMPSKEPFDSAIRPYVRKEKFESCSSEAPITRIAREENGTVVLFMDTAATAFRPGTRCCWSAVLRASNESSSPPRRAPAARMPRRPPRLPSASDKQAVSADGPKESSKRSAVDSSIV